MSEAKRPPSPDGVPLLGNGLDFSHDPFAAMTEWATEGDVVRLDFPGRTQYMITGPELVRQVLVENHSAFTIGRRQQETFEGIEDDAVTAASGERWRRLRKALQPAFEWEGIRAYGDRMVELTGERVDGWRDGEEVDLLREMRLLTVHVLADTILGVDVENDEKTVLDAADALVEWADFRRFGHLLPDWVPTPTQRRFDSAVADLDASVDDALQRHSVDGSTVAGALLRAHERGELTWDEVRDNTAGLLLAGHDSSAVTLTYAWYELSRHPRIRASLVEEYEAVVGDGVPTVDDFEALRRTRNVLRETLRLYPPTWAVSRAATEAVRLGEYELPAGAQLMLPQWVLHRDDRFWENSEAFDPSRGQRETDRPEYAYFPFSGGPRHCMGMRFARLELALALATMVGRVELDVSLVGPLTFTPSLSLRPETDLPVTVSRRAPAVD